MQLTPLKRTLSSPRAFDYPLDRTIYAQFTGGLADHIHAMRRSRQVNSILRLLIDLIVNRVQVIRYTGEV